jgi:hypothetical protein
MMVLEKKKKKKIFPPCLIERRLGEIEEIGQGRRDCSRASGRERSTEKEEEAERFAIWGRDWYVKPVSFSTEVTPSVATSFLASADVLMTCRAFIVSETANLFRYWVIACPIAITLTAQVRWATRHLWPDLLNISIVSAYLRRLRSLARGTALKGAIFSISAVLVHT